ncbi:MAG: hypothetical protein RLO51_18245 [Thalassobaculum sp.]|uniref:hypothetical protein n=1 Tax=Thalassobaculum sp. TaxID=2022740 RepID=UPI0032EBDA08
MHMPAGIFPMPALVAALLLALAAGPAAAGPLETLERERAALLSTLLDPALDPGDRQARADASVRRLVDLERMVLRDPPAAGSGAVANRAFADYDLTFLAHASVERAMAPLDLWLDRLGVSADRLLAARVGRR